MNEVSEVAALVDKAMAAATKALTANKVEWKGVISVQPQPDGAIAYRFGVMIPFEDSDWAKLASDFQIVTAIIEQNCRMHVVRAAPLFETEQDFLTDVKWAQGYMRGHMIGVGLGVGPAVRSAPPSEERVVMSSGT